MYGLDVQLWEVFILGLECVLLRGGLCDFAFEDEILWS